MHARPHPTDRAGHTPRRRGPTVVILANHFREECRLSFVQRLIERGWDLGFLFLATVGSPLELGGQPLALPERTPVKPLSRRNQIVAVDELVLAVEAITRGYTQKPLEHSVGHELVARRVVSWRPRGMPGTGAVYPSLVTL
jgi:hypothetical protein